METIAEALATAVRYHEGGDLFLAEPIYRQVLAADSTHPQAWFLLAVLYHTLGRLDEAVTAYRQTIALKAEWAEPHNNLGVALENQGKPHEAAKCYRQALHLRPEYPEALNNLGAMLIGQGQLQEAAAKCERALQIKPDFAEAYNNLGVALAAQGRLDDALTSYQHALLLRPGYAEAHNNLGNALKEQGQLDKAVASFREALRFKPRYAEAHNNLGTALALKGELDGAARCYEEALRLRPAYAEAFNNLGAALHEQKRLDEAMACYQQALQLKPDYAEAHNNVGNLFREQGRLDEALERCLHALRLNPGLAEAHNSHGAILADRGKVDEALDYYEEALRLRPGYADAHYNRAMAWLLLGDFQRGWPEYEWRWWHRRASLPAFEQPLWDGSPLAGRRILLHAEQGLGDTLQFIRYATLVKDRGGTVLVACSEALHPLLRRCPGIDRLVASDRLGSDFDVHAPLMSLPRILGTTLATVPAGVPYLFADEGLVGLCQRELRAIKSFKIGIAWQGNPNYAGDRQRSIPLAHFAPLASLPDVQLFSLQKGFGAQQLNEVAGRFPVTDLSSRLDETSGAFMDTAALMTNLDLVVTSDTAIPHLAGALAVPVWVALPFAPDWRWLLDRQDSPWYPTMRLFRQSERRCWEEVFQRLTGQLDNILGSFTSNGADPG